MNTFFSLNLLFITFFNIYFLTVDYIIFFILGLMFKLLNFEFRYTLLLFLLEYRAAKLLIKNSFPGTTAASITKFELDSDVISLYGQDAPLTTQSETDENGRIKVRIRRSISSAPPESTSSITNTITPTRLSNLSNADIFSINTPMNFLDNASPRLSGYASTDAYSLQPTPRGSNVNETDVIGTPVLERSPVGGGRGLRGNSPVVDRGRVVWESPEKWRVEERQGCKDITMSGTCLLKCSLGQYSE
jgi:auxin efflux carrier family